MANSVSGIAEFAKISKLCQEIANFAALIHT